MPPFATNADLDYATWLVRILPFVERGQDFARWDLYSRYEFHPAEARTAVVPTYLCPSRRDAGQAVTPFGTGPMVVLPCGCSFPGEVVQTGAAADYAGNMGDTSPGSSGLPTDFYWGVNGTGVLIACRPKDGGRTADWMDKVRIADVADGTSNTVLIGEMHVPRDKLASLPDNGLAYDGSRFYNSARVGGPGVPLATGPEDDVGGMGLYAFGSWHPGVCSFAFADGRVVAVRTSIGIDTLSRLCHRSDGQPVQDY